MLATCPTKHARNLHQPWHHQLILNHQTTKAKLLLAIQALEQGQFQSVREAAKAYSVNRNTLSNRRAGVSSRRDCTLTMRKLTDLEESVIVQYILDLDSRGFSP